ncbi:venom allergen antigen 5-like protein [Aphelenchoides avenae]|nr:venom allergen antigen 5-like protein [Aphelenchus avenae]
MRLIVALLLISCSSCSVEVKSPKPGNYDNEAGELKPAERAQIIKLTNDFRSRAAKGLLVNKDGKSLAKGEEIYAVTYNVSLEKRARDYVSKCETRYRPSGDTDNTGFIFLLLGSEVDAADALNVLYGFAAGQARKYGIRESLAYYDPDVLAWSQVWIQ